MAVVDLHFFFCRGERVLAHVPLVLDVDTLTLQSPDIPKPLPDWARLEFKQCSNCTLQAAESPYCPFATQLVGPLERLRPIIGEKSVTLRVVSEFGVVSEETSVASAVSSLMSLLCASGGCPQMGFLRPLARVTLPLEPAVATTRRATGFYTLTQMFLRRGSATDEALTGLSQIYKDVQTVNNAMAKRLRAALASEEGAMQAERLIKLFAEILPRAADDQLAACGERLDEDAPSI